MRRRLLRSLLSGAAVACALSSSPRARADGHDACMAAADEGQVLRDGGRLRAARAKFLECASDACPAIVRSDCSNWVSSVDERLPAVTIHAVDGGRDVVDVRVYAEGKLITSTLDGRGIAVDPGLTTFRFEREGAASVEQRVLIRERDKNHVLEVKFGGDAAPSSTAPIPPLVRAEPPAPSPVEPTKRPFPVGPVVLTGVAVAGGVVFAYFASTAKNNLEHLRSTCAPACADSDVSKVRAELIVANVSLGVGVAALAAAAWWFFSGRAADRAPGVALCVSPAGSAALYGAF